MSSTDGAQHPEDPGVGLNTDEHSDEEAETHDQEEGSISDGKGYEKVSESVTAEISALAPSVSSGVASNVYAQPFIPSTHLVNSLDKGEVVYSSKPVEWKREDYMYTGHNPLYESMSGSQPQIMDALPLGQYSTSRAFSHRQTFDKPDKFYYPRDVASDSQLLLGQKPYYARRTAQNPVGNFFVVESLRNEINAGVRAAHQVPPDTMSGVWKVELDPYYGLYSLSRQHSSIPRFFGYPDAAYKAFSSQDNNVYVLRRIKGFTLYNEEAFSTINQWVSLKHPNIVNLKEALTTKAFGDNSLVFVYDYHPLAVTLEYKKNKRENSHETNGIPEALLWTYVVQIVGALKAIHSSNLAARVIDPHNLIVTDNNRIRINSCGVVDTMVKGIQYNIKHAQDEDLYCLGNLIIYLTTGTSAASGNISNSLDIISNSYSQDVTSLVLYLVGRSYHRKSLSKVMMMISSKTFDDLRNAYSYSDFIKSELTKELQNGRFTRLLCKLGFINERPEFEMDPDWSETGDRYLIKLFRDYIFHQVDENMRPIVDIGHALYCLNKVATCCSISFVIMTNITTKLDCGVDEKIMLTSRDGQSCLIVSYKELKKCISKSFSQLLGK